MKWRRIIAAATIGLFFCMKGMAQQDLLFTQQLFSRGNINPAGLGNTADVDIFLLGRLQWLGVDKAPHTLLLNASNHLPQLQSTFGITLSHDALGIGHKTTEAKVEYAYQIDLTQNWILSMGVSAGVFVGIYDPNANTLVDESERNGLDLLRAKAKEATPDFNIGFEANERNWTLGVSCTHIENDRSTSYSSDRHIYAYAIRAIMLGAEWDALASAAYMNRNKVHLADIGMQIFHQRKIWAGISWRPDLRNGCNPSYLSFIIGFEHNIARFGYVYEMGLGTNNTLPSNTHEVLCSFRIPKKSTSLR